MSCTKRQPRIPFQAGNEAAASHTLRARQFYVLGALAVTATVVDLASSAALAAAESSTRTSRKRYMLPLAVVGLICAGGLLAVQVTALVTISGRTGLHLRSLALVAFSLATTAGVALYRLAALRRRLAHRSATARGAGAPGAALDGAVVNASHDGDLYDAATPRLGVFSLITSRDLRRSLSAP